MEREYDLFKRLPDGSVLWQTSVVGIEAARTKLLELAKATNSEYFALHAPSGVIAARAGPEGDRHVLRVFQIGYDESLMNTRATLLKKKGCDVTSVFGNAAAKRALSLSGVEYELFMVGHSAPEAERRDIVIWLKRKYPHAKVLALNPPDSPQLTDADFNVIQDGPEKWLAVIAAM